MLLIATLVMFVLPATELLNFLTESDALATIPPLWIRWQSIIISTIEATSNIDHPADLLQSLREFSSLL